MRSSYFDSCTLEEKIELLSTEGVYLMCRKNSLYNIFLYSIDRLYIEVLYQRKSSEMQNILLITTEKVLDYYLNEMSFEFV